MPDADPAHYVRGQYEGYRAIDGVAADSETETYAALRLEVDNWRWSGVPFYIRTGKRLPVHRDRAAAASSTTRRGSHFLGSGPATARRPTRSSCGSTRGTGVRLVLDAQRADQPGPGRSTLDMEFAQEGGEGATPYEVLLHAAMIGDSTRFTRQDGVEEAWRIMQPLLTLTAERCRPTRRDRGARTRRPSCPPGMAGGTGRGAKA